MKTTKYIIALAFTVWCALGNLYAVTPTYYNVVDGKSGKNLFDAVHTVSKTGYKGVSYDGLWTAYCAIDINSSGKVWDMYSNATSYTCGSSAQGGNYSKEGDSYNREHSIPKSWFGGSTSSNTPGTDLFHVVPTDGYVNNKRSNYAFGEVATASYTSKSGCKLGTAKSISISNSILNTSGASAQSCSKTPVFEPMDEFKGDFARGYFATMVRWANGDYQTFTTGDGAAIFNTAYDAAHYYGLTGYGVALLLKWHREDPVSQKEIDRNDGIQSKQGNRNPFIDYPELVEYIWGNHTGETVTLANLTPTFDGYTPPVTTTYTIILSRNGVTEAITGQSGTYNLPAKNTEADACDNWAFDGWATTDVSSATTAKPSYVTSVTSASTVYAVYAKTVSSGSAPHRATMAESTATYTFTSKSWAATEGNWTSGKDGNGYSNSGVQVTTGTTEANATCPTSYSNISSIVVSYCTNSSKGAGTIVMSVGETEVSQTVSTSGGTTARDLTFDFSSTKPTGTPKITVTCTTNSIYVCGVTINYGTSGGSTTTTYYASEPEDCNCSGELPTPVVTATPSDGAITLTWSDVTNATNGYSVTIDKGVGYTTECGDVEIGEVTHSGTTNTCVISGLVNGLSYTTSVVANGTTATCESDAGTATATPVGCSPWDITFGYSTYTLNAGGATVSPTITGTQHGAVTYESSNTSVLTVNASGVVTPVSAGTATVTAHWAGDGTYCPKDVTSSTFTVNGKVIVTFDKNDGSGTTTTQQVDYNTATALTANTFTRTGYTFQGWATEASGAKVYNDGASITITAATTLYAVWQVNSHNVSFSKPTGASNLTVNGVTTSPKSVNYGSTVTIVVTPAAHYSVGSVTADGGVTVTDSDNNWSFTMPDKDVAITVTMVEDTKYTVNWYVSGTPTEEVNYAGEALAGIADPTIDCNGKVFMGWTATADYSDAITAPADMFTDASIKTMPSNNSTNYYAVFATQTTSGSGAGGWSETAIADLTSSDVFVIVGTNNSGAYAMTNDNGTSSAPAATSVTISDGKISGTVADNLKWNISGNATDGYTFYPNGSTTTWLYCTSNNNGVRVGTNTNKGFSINSGYLYNTATSRYVGIYNSSDWRCYTSSGTNIGGQSFAFYKYTSGSTTTYTDYSTSCSAPVLYEITVNGTEHGTITTSPSATAASGSTVTVTITPDEWYDLATLTVEDENESPITVNGDGNTRTFTMPESNVTISATFVEKQKYAINFYVEGTLASSQNVYVGSTPEVPSTPVSCDGGYTFVGWWTSTLDSDNTTAQSWIVDFTATQACDYYAVFSYTEATGGASSVTDVLTRATTGITGTSYSDWSDKTLTSDAVYAGQSAGGSESIQLRSTNSNSGIVTTATGGTATKVVVVWNSSTTDGRVLNIYGKNTAYSDATDLYDSSKQGTLLGTIVCGTSTELTVTGDYAYIGFRSASGAMYLTSVSVTWSAAGVGTTYYTTSTCSAPEPIMMVSELDGAYFAVTHEITDSAIAALELIGVNDTYYYKPGTNTADITWYIQRGRVSNYLSNSTGLYLAVNGKSIAMRAERFAWTVNDAGQFVTADNTGLCYDSKNRAFVVADKTGNDANNWHLSLSAAEQSLDALQVAETYTRGGVTNDQYITICLPYAVSQTFLETAEVFNVSGKFVTGNRVTGIALTPEEGILEAGRPYVVHTLSSPLNAYYGEITATEVVPALGLVGNLSEEPLAVPAGCYGLANSRLRLVSEGGIATTGQYKAYFDLRDVPEVSSTNLPMGSKMMYTTDTTETPTDVDALFGNSSQINWQLPVYNVLGIQVGEDATGVLIQNGIKFLKY